jgi:glycosyltransferase involved in cell wall biosynthesis
MRYLIYTETFPSRTPNATRQTGIGRYCADLAAGLVSLGHEVVVLTNDAVGAGPAAEPYAVRLLGRAPRTPLEMLRRGGEVSRAVRVAAPDYVLVGDPVAHRVIGMRPRGALDVPVCPVLYGSELVAWRAWQRSRSLRTLLRRWWLSRYLSGAYTHICISRFTQRLLREVAPGLGEGCLVYPSVSELFLRRPLRQQPAAGAPLTLLTIARISERKNQLGVLQALAHLRRNGGPAWRYLILGNVDAESHRPYLAEMERFIAANGLTGAVTIIGNSTDEEKIDYIDACDASIMLSQSAGGSIEGFGIAVIEAACRAKPVVVSDQGGMPETIIEGVTGFAVPPADTARVAQVLAQLASDPGLRTTMGAAGRRFTLENFTPAATAAGLHTQLLAHGERSHHARPRSLPPTALTR